MSIAIFIGKWSFFARIVAAIAVASSEGLKVEQKVEQNLLGKFSRLFTQHEPPLWGCRVPCFTVQRRSNLVSSVNGAVAGPQTRRTKTPSAHDIAGYPKRSVKIIVWDSLRFGQNVTSQEQLNSHVPRNNCEH
jgi:hypothetical protein